MSSIWLQAQQQAHVQVELYGEFFRLSADGSTDVNDLKSV
jgi:hypothetical protein